MISILLSLLVGVFAPDKSSSLSITQPPAAHRASGPLEIDRSITSLAVQPASNKTEVLVRVDGDVTWRHFALKNPDRVVIDIAGAKQGLALEFADIQRGGVGSMRIGQFSPEVVRVVIDLAQSVRYEAVEGEPGVIRISFPN